MRRFFVPVWIVLASLTSAAEPPSAAEQLPFRSLFSREELARDFDRRRIHPFGERWMHFDLVVPKTWEGRPIELSRERLLEDSERPVPLARLGPPQRTDVFVEVQYLRLERALPPRRAIEGVAERAGAELLVGQHGDFSGRKVDDALLRVDDGDDARLLRATASRHGDLVFLVVGSAPAADYEAFKRTLATAAVGFILGEGGIPQDVERGVVEF